MIAEVEKRKVVESGDFKKKTFSINMSAEAVEILSKGLYSDAQTAVLRELGTNCVDAHIAAGVPDEPFEVNLPTQWENKLRFRDYGPGLSPDEIDDIYTVYFQSSKSQSNEYTGMLGLGSKSPLSLTDSFTVVSYQNGEKTTYTVFKNEEGLPEIARLAVEKTTERNGLEILIGTPRGSQYDFERKASQVYRWFKVKPKVSPSPSYPQIETILTEGKWRVVKSGGNWAVMGNIAYPIDLNLLNQTCISKFGNSNIIIEFKIGELDISASREKLQYTLKTKTAIEAQLLEILDKTNKLFQVELDKQTNYFDAVVYYNDSRNVLIDANKVSYNGKSLVIYAIDLVIARSTYDYVLNSAIPGEKFNCVSWDRKKFSNCESIPYYKDIILYLDDLPKGGESRLKQYILSSGSSYRSNIYYLFDLSNGKTQQELLDRLGIDPSKLLLTSSLPEVVRAKGPKRGTTEKVIRYKNAYSGSYSWENVTVNTSDTLYYVPINRFKIVVEQPLVSLPAVSSPVVSSPVVIQPTLSREWDSDKLQDIRKWLIDYKLMPDDTNIYGVRTAFSKKGRKNWINIVPLLHDNFDQLFKIHKIQEIADAIKSYESIGYGFRSHWEKLAKHKLSFIGKSLASQELCKSIELYEKVKKSNQDDTNILDNFKSVAIILGKEIEGKPYQIMSEVTISQKPLLNWISWDRWVESDVVQYINQ